MSSHIECVAVLTPAEGKKERCQKVLLDLANSVQNDEHTCLRYQVCYQEFTGEFVVIERYQDQAAYDAHSQTAHFAKAVQIAVGEEALTKPIEFKILKVLGGFDGR